MAENAQPTPAPAVEAPKPAEEKPAEAKPAEAKPAEAKPAETKLAQVGKEEEAASDDSDIEIPAAPPLHGHLNKQSPAMLRLRGWDQRFFLLADMKIMWWTNMNECLKALDSSDTAALVHRLSTTEADIGTSSKKGMVNFELTNAVVEAEPDSETIFSLKPVNKWAKGSTTDIRDDDKRVYKFDCKGCEHPRAMWLEVLSEHIKKGEEMRTSGKARISERWEDATISEDQLAAAARLVKKLEARGKKPKR